MLDLKGFLVNNCTCLWSKVRLWSKTNSVTLILLMKRFVMRYDMTKNIEIKLVKVGLIYSNQAGCNTEKLQKWQQKTQLKSLKPSWTETKARLKAVYNRTGFYRVCICEAELGWWISRVRACICRSEWTSLDKTHLSFIIEANGAVTLSPSTTSTTLLTLYTSLESSQTLAKSVRKRN